MLHASSPYTPMSRLAFVDNLRVFLTVLVVAHHAGQPYGPTDGRWLIFNPERANVLGAFFAVNAAFFMGLFFLISGYFVPGAYDRKGAAKFLQDRCLRLGVPVFVFAVAVFPLVFYLTIPGQSFEQFLIDRHLSQGYVEVGHLWFLVHLLIYAIVYVLWRRWQQSSPGCESLIAAPSHGWIGGYLVGLAIVTFIVRILYPIDVWVRVLGVIPVEMAHLPQYLSLFVMGMMAYRHNWLYEMPAQRGMIWLAIGLIASLLRYAYALGGEKWFPTRLIAGGGWDWRSLLWSTWEAVICVGMSVGLLTLFREQVNLQGRLLQSLSVNAYTVYVIHILIVVAVQFSIASLVLHPLIKFSLVTLVSVPLCFVVSHYLRKLSIVNNVL